MDNKVKIGLAFVFLIQGEIQQILNVIFSLRISLLLPEQHHLELLIVMLICVVFECSTTIICRDKVVLLCQRACINIIKKAGKRLHR